MALKVGELFATLNLDDKDFAKNLKSAQKQTDTLKSAISSSEKTIERYGTALDSVKKSLSEAMRAQADNVAKLESAKKAQSELKQTIAQLNTAYKAQVKATGENSNAANELGLQLLDAKEALTKTNSEIRKLATESRNGDKNVDKLNKSIAEISGNLDSAKAGLAKFKAELNAANSLLGSNAAKLSEASAKMKEYAASIQSATEWQNKAGTTLTTSVTAPIVTGLGYAAKETIDFEDAFTGVEKTVDASEAVLEGLKETFIELSEKIPVTKEELAAIGEQAGQLGISADVIDEFTETIANLNATTNLGEEAASALAQFANITQMAKQYDDLGQAYEALGSTIVDLGNNSATSEAKIVGMAMRLAGAGANANMSQADILGISTALSSLGIEAEMGGSAFSRLINDMLIAVETGSDELQGFAEVAGMTAAQFEAAFREDAAQALSDFIVGLGNGSQTAIQIMDELGITELRLTDALSRSANASELFSSSISRANKAWDENSALATEASKKYKNTASRLKMLKNKIDNTAMSFGDAMLPAIEMGIEKIDEFVGKFSDLDEGTRTSVINMGLFAASIGPALKLLGTANSMFSSVISGLGGIASAAASAGGGFLGLGSAILKGIGSALGPAGLLITAGVSVAVAWNLLKTEDYQPNLSGKVADILDGITISDEIMAKVTADFELSEETQTNITEFTNEATSVYDEIEKALTDGQPDSSTVISGLKENVTGLFSDVRTNIESWYNTEMEKLDLSTAEGIAQAEELTRMRDEYIAQTTATEEATSGFVDTWAGASTTLVQQHVGELDTLLAKITSLNEEIKIREELARSAQKYSFDVVSMGQTSNTETIAEALNYAYMNWKLDDKAISQYASEQFDLANQAFSAGGEEWTSFLKSSGLFEQLGEGATYADWEALFTANQSAEIAAASQAYQNNIRAVLEGIMQSYGSAGEAFQIDLSKYMSGESALSGIDELIDVQSLATMTPEQKSSITTAIDELLQSYAVVMGEEFAGSETLKKALQTDDTLTFSSVLNGLQGEITTAMEEIETGLVSSLEGEDLSGVGEALKLIVESGMLEGVSGVDMTSVDSQLSVILAALGTTGTAVTSANTLGGDIGAGVGEGLEGTNYDSYASATIDNIEGSLRSSAQSHSPAVFFNPVGNDIGAGVGEGMKSFDFTSAASEMISSIKSALSSSTSSLSSVGLNFARGLASGIRAGRTIVTSAAHSIALAAVDAAKSTLQIHSPSKVTELIGGYFGKGFAKGITGTISLATGAANDLARSAANAATFRNPGARTQAAYTANTTGRQAIDYDRLADAMSRRPLYMEQDGVIYAEIQEQNNAIVRNSRARSIALGYGK